MSYYDSAQNLKQIGNFKAESGHKSIGLERLCRNEYKPAQKNQPKKS